MDEHDGGRVYGIRELWFYDECVGALYFDYKLYVLLAHPIYLCLAMIV